MKRYCYRKDMFSKKVEIRELIEFKGKMYAVDEIVSGYSLTEIKNNNYFTNVEDIIKVLKDYKNSIIKEYDIYLEDIEKHLKSLEIEK